MGRSGRDERVRRHLRPLRWNVKRRGQKHRLIHGHAAVRKNRQGNWASIGGLVSLVWQYPYLFVFRAKQMLFCVSKYKWFIFPDAGAGREEFSRVVVIRRFSWRRRSVGEGAVGARRFRHHDANHREIDQLSRLRSHRFRHRLTYQLRSSRGRAICPNLFVYCATAQYRIQSSLFWTNNSLHDLKTHKKFIYNSFI